MKKLFFTSNTKHYHKTDGKKIANEIDNTNGLVNQIKGLMDNTNGILFIAANPYDIEKADNYATLIFKGLKLSGVSFSNYFILDDRTRKNTIEYIKESNVIFLGGGETYKQNKFFHDINLKELLRDFEGIIIGQSAGALNMAESVYNSPEEGALSEPIYFEGLGLSKINIEPHFILDTTEFDDMQIYQRKHLLEESKKRKIYALCDGTHILELDESAIICGEAFLIEDGIITKICGDKQVVNFDI